MSFNLETYHTLGLYKIIDNEKDGEIIIFDPLTRRIWIFDSESTENLRQIEEMGLEQSLKKDNLPKEIKNFLKTLETQRRQAKNATINTLLKKPIRLSISLKDDFQTNTNKFIKKIIDWFENQIAETDECDLTFDIHLPLKTDDERHWKLLKELNAAIQEIYVNIDIDTIQTNLIIELNENLSVNEVINRIIKNIVQQKIYVTHLQLRLQRIHDITKLRDNSKATSLFSTLNQHCESLSIGFWSNHISEEEIAILRDIHNYLSENISFIGLSNPLFLKWWESFIQNMETGFLFVDKLINWLALLVLRADADILPGGDSKTKRYYTIEVKDEDFRIRSGCELCVGKLLTSYSHDDKDAVNFQLVVCNRCEFKSFCPTYCQLKTNNQIPSTPKECKIYHFLISIIYFYPQLIKILKPQLNNRITRLSGTTSINLLHEFEKILIASSCPFS